MLGEEDESIELHYNMGVAYGGLASCLRELETRNSSSQVPLFSTLVPRLLHLGSSIATENLTLPPTGRRCPPDGMREVRDGGTHG